MFHQWTRPIVASSTSLTDSQIRLEEISSADLHPSRHLVSARVPSRMACHIVRIP